MEKIRDQLSNIERKANEVRANTINGQSPTPEEGVALNASLERTPLFQADPFFNFGATAAKSTLTPPLNSLGIDVGNAGNVSEKGDNPTPPPLIPVSSPPVVTDLSSKPENDTPKTVQDQGGQLNEPSPLDFSLDKSQYAWDDNFGETVVGGMKVTLLNLKDHEKEDVEAKV